jgi:hypothetical protein
MNYMLRFERDLVDPDTSISGDPHAAFEQLKIRMRRLLRDFPTLQVQVLAGIDELKEHLDAITTWQ